MIDKTAIIVTVNLNNCSKVK